MAVLAKGPGMRRSILPVLALVVLVALAGCGGDDATATEPETNGQTPTDTDAPNGPTATDGMDNPTSTDTDGEESPTATDGMDGGTATTTPSDAWTLFQFEHPARYEYELRQSGEEPATIVLDVTDVSDEQVTVRTSYRSGDTTFNQTFSGTAEEVRSQLAQSPSGAVLISGLFNPALGGVEASGRFQVGATWEHTAEGQTLRYEVTGQDSYAGVDCYTMEVSTDDVTQGEFCVSPEHGLSAYVGIYEDGTLQFEMELVEYEATE